MDYSILLMLAYNNLFKTFFVFFFGIKTLHITYLIELTLYVVLD